jgi:hypothetical protein
VEDFIEELDRLKMELAKGFGDDQLKHMPERLFHYTNADGLLGILSSRKFWATHMKYLNDSSELSYGSALVADRIANLAKQYESVPQWKAFLDLAHMNRNAFEGFLEAYAICFCTEGDLLSQWRGYGSSGGGYSIGLQPIPTNQPVTTARAISTETRPFLRKVIYDPEKQRELVDIAIVEVSSIVVRYWEKQRSKEAKVLLFESCVSALRDMLVNYLICLKNAVFEEEAEWRYVIVRPQKSSEGPPKKFRARSGAIVPYLEVDLFTQPHGEVRISDIYCGPILHPELSVVALEDALATMKYENVTVHRSSIPIRG